MVNSLRSFSLGNTAGRTHCGLATHLLRPGQPFAVLLLYENTNLQGGISK